MLIVDFCLFLPFSCALMVVTILTTARRYDSGMLRYDLCNQASLIAYSNRTIQSNYSMMSLSLAVVPRCSIRLGLE